MKLMTLNTHSLVETDYPTKLDAFVTAISECLPDIIALQEANQTAAMPSLTGTALENFTFCAGLPVKEDNHVYHAVKNLHQMGIVYHWTWLGMKLGYGRYDEGIAVMSRSRILEAKACRISRIDDYHNWKTRKIIGIRTEASPDTWFFSVHFGWWNDPEEPFQEQWKRTAEVLPRGKEIWLMGDFNNPAGVRNEGYDLMIKDGWYDSYSLAEDRDNGITVEKVIDGWKGRTDSTAGMRIDQLWCNKRPRILNSQVIFNGKNKAVISDHYGVLIEVKR